MSKKTSYKNSIVSPVERRWVRDYYYDTTIFRVLPMVKLYTYRLCDLRYDYNDYSLTKIFESGFIPNTSIYNLGSTVEQVDNITNKLKIN